MAYLDVDDSEEAAAEHEDEGSPGVKRRVTDHHRHMPGSTMRSVKSEPLPTCAPTWGDRVHALGQGRWHPRSVTSPSSVLEHQPQMKAASDIPEDECEDLVEDRGPVLVLHRKFAQGRGGWNHLTAIPLLLAPITYYVRSKHWHVYIPR